MVESKESYATGPAFYPIFIPVLLRPHAAACWRSATPNGTIGLVAVSGAQMGLRGCNNVFVFSRNAKSTVFLHYFPHEIPSSLILSRFLFGARSERLPQETNNIFMGFDETNKSSNFLSRWRVCAQHHFSSRISVGNTVLIEICPACA